MKAISRILSSSFSFTSVSSWLPQNPTRLRVCCPPPQVRLHDPHKLQVPKNGALPQASSWESAGKPQEWIRNLERVPLKRPNSERKSVFARISVGVWPWRNLVVIIHREIFKLSRNGFIGLFGSYYLFSGKHLQAVKFTSKHRKNPGWRWHTLFKKHKILFVSQQMEIHLKYQSLNSYWSISLAL